MYRSFHSLSARLLLGAFLIVSSTAAVAQTGGMPRPYVGAGVASFDVVDRFTGFGIFGGFQFNDNVAAELGYLRGEDDATSGGASATATISIFSLAAVGRLPIHENFAFTGRIGWYYWEEEGCASGFGITNLCLEFDGNDPLFGIGADLDFTENVRGQITFTRYTDNNAYDVDVIAGNIAYLF